MSASHAQLEYERAQAEPVKSCNLNLFMDDKFIKKIFRLLYLY